MQCKAGVSHAKKSCGFTWWWYKPFQHEYIWDRSYLSITIKIWIFRSLLLPVLFYVLRHWHPSECYKSATADNFLDTVKANFAYSSMRHHCGTQKAALLTSAAVVREANQIVSFGLSPETLRKKK